MNRKRDERKAQKVEEKKRQEAHNKRMAELRMQVHLDVCLRIRIQFHFHFCYSTWTTTLWMARLAEKANLVQRVRISSSTRTPSPASAASPQRRRSSGGTLEATRWQGSTTLWQTSLPRLSLSTSGRWRGGAANTSSCRSRSATPLKLQHVLPKSSNTFKHLCNIFHS